jgi:segregation and condensation protein B
MSEKIKKNRKQKRPIALVEDPFGFKTLEVSQAQASETEQNLGDDFSDELEEDLEDDFDDEETELSIESAEKADKALTRIAEAVAEQTEADLAVAVLQEESPQEIAVQAAEELARQIAEDQALQAEMAREAQQAEEDLATDPELRAALPEGTDLEEVQSCLEALLFLADRPISLNKFREHLTPVAAPDSEEKPELFPLNVLQEALTQLKDRFMKPAHGIELVEVNGGYQFRTKPIRAPLVKKLSKIQTQRLSSGAMETLAIVAYRQPVMKEEVDKVRGVDSSYFVRGLLDRKLIKISGRSELPGRPMLYSTSDDFLEIFGLKDLDALPPLRELEQMVPTSQSGNPEDEDPRVRKMRELVSEMNTDKSTSLIYDPREDEKILSEIKERIGSIPVSTPYLDEQKALEKAASEASKRPKIAVAEEGPAQPELTEAIEVAPLVEEAVPPATEETPEITP